MGQHVKLSDVSFGTRPRYSPVVDEDVEKPTKQTKNDNSNRKQPKICILIKLSKLRIDIKFNTSYKTKKESKNIARKTKTDLGIDEITQHNKPLTA